MEKLKILFVVDDYFPVASANSVCIIRLQEELYKRGIQSDIVCYGEEYNIERITKYGILRTVRKTDKSGVVRKLEMIKNFFIWPIRSLRRINEYKRIIKELYDNNQYVFIVSVLRPIEGAIACSKYTNNLLYELDSITNNADNYKGVKKLLKHRAFILERILYKRAKCIVHMQSHTNYYNAKRYEKFREKSIILDLPGLVRPLSCDKIHNKNPFINVVYTGILNSQFRSPQYSLELFKNINDVGKHIKLSFYSRGDCDDILRKKEYEYFTRLFGYVPLDEIPQVYASADFLLNIGNNFKGKVTSFPSKTIEYISTGKPIIHISGGENDSAIPYIDKYQNGIVINPAQGLEDNVKALIEFMSSHIGRSIDFDELASIYKRCTPEYNVDMILHEMGVFVEG